MTKIAEHAQTLFAGLTLAAILWTGSSINDTAKLVAVHEWRISAIERALAEGKP